MPRDANQVPPLIPTVADVGLTFPIAVLSVEDLARLADAKLVVLIGAGPDAKTGVPLTVYPPVHGEAVVAWTVESFVDMLLRDDSTEDVDDLLNDYPAFLMCCYRVAEMLLGGDASVDRGILLKGSPSVDKPVFLDSNDLRLILLHSDHDTLSCGCARGRMLPFTAIVAGLLLSDDDPAG